MVFRNSLVPITDPKHKWRLALPSRRQASKEVVGRPWVPFGFPLRVLLYFFWPAPLILVIVFVLLAQV